MSEIINPELSVPFLADTASEGVNKASDMKGIGKMTSITCLEPSLAQLHDEESEADLLVSNFIQNYQKWADEADKCLQEKQAYELEKFFGRFLLEQ
jgi:hypothetical protein